MVTKRKTPRLDRALAEIPAIDVVEEDAMCTSGRAPQLKVMTPALFLRAEPETFIREINGLDRGEACGVVVYVVLDGRHIRVEVRDLDGPIPTLPAFDTSGRKAALSSQDPARGDGR